MDTPENVAVKKYINENLKIEIVSERVQFSSDIKIIVKLLLADKVVSEDYFKIEGRVYNSFPE